MDNKNLPVNKLKPFVKWTGSKIQFFKIINLLVSNEYDLLIEPLLVADASGRAVSCLSNLCNY